METIEEIHKVRCHRNQKGLFNCIIETSRGEREYEDLPNLMMKDRVTGREIIIAQDKLISLLRDVNGPKAHYYPEEKKLIFVK